MPPVLPAPGDARGRALAFFTSLPVRRAVGVGDVPGGVAAGTDNIIFTEGTLDGFEHPICFDQPGRGNHIEIANNLPTTHEIGPDE